CTAGDDRLTCQTARTGTGAPARERSGSRSSQEAEPRAGIPRGRPRYAPAHRYTRCYRRPRCDCRHKPKWRSDPSTLPDLVVADRGPNRAPIRVRVNIPTLKTVRGRTRSAETRFATD